MSEFDINVMKTPPLWSTVRVNTLKIEMVEAKRRMESILIQQYEARKGAFRVKPTVQLHPTIPDLLMIRGSGPHPVEAVGKEIYVDGDCGCAVMRGADIYAPGILASNGYFAEGETVSVYMDLDGRCKRGLKRQYDGNRTFLGNGITAYSRTDIFSSANPDGKSFTGVGVSMTDPIWNHPKLDGAVIANWGFVQNLPSVVCGHVLDPRPGEMVLDMCAAPGGKSTHLATLMNDQGQVICVDSSPNRIKELTKNVEALSLNSITSYRMNAINLVASSENSQCSAQFQPETFDRILLDAPCSCTGQRPFIKTLTDKQKRSHVPQQRKLLETAYKLLKRGGVMVYSTCSLEEDENENQITWFLNRHPDMELAPQEPFIGRNVMLENQKIAVQKFDPRKSLKESSKAISPVAGNVTIDFSYDEDTIGFFISKMIKK